MFWASGRFAIAGDVVKPVLAVTWTLPAVLAVALFRLAVGRRWKALKLVLLTVVCVMPLAGMIQFERCPHATYLQLFGMSIPVEGRACGNIRRIEPWWMRE